MIQGTQDKLMRATVGERFFRSARRSGDLIYFPTMVGMVYVLWNAPLLNQDALVSWSDLGPAGETWSLSGLAYADGFLYARTLKELICIGKKAE